MDTEKCRVLLRVLESGSLTGAAEQMGYTPSGVSRVVAALEREAGFPLLVRSHGGVRPTESCQRLLPVARELVRWGGLWEQTAAEIRGVETGSVTVGTAYNAYYPWLAGVVAAFGQAYPGAVVRILESTSTALAESVAAGEMDFAIISRREGAFHWNPWRQDEMVALVSGEHPAASRGVFRLEELGGEPFIEMYPGQESDNSRLLTRLGIRPNVRYATGDVHSAWAMVEAGLGITLMNGLFMEHYAGPLAVLPLEPRQWVEIGCAVPPPELRSPAAARFAAFAKEL